MYLDKGIDLDRTIFTHGVKWPGFPGLGQINGRDMGMFSVMMLFANGRLFAMTHNCHNHFPHLNYEASVDAVLLRVRTLVSEKDRNKFDEQSTGTAFYTLEHPKRDYSVVGVYRDSLSSQLYILSLAFVQGHPPKELPIPTPESPNTVTEWVEEVDRETMMAAYVQSIPKELWDHKTEFSRYCRLYMAGTTQGYNRIYVTPTASFDEACHAAQKPFRISIEAQSEEIVRHLMSPSVGNLTDIALNINMGLVPGGVTFIGSVRMSYNSVKKFGLNRIIRMFRRLDTIAFSKTYLGCLSPVAKSWSPSTSAFSIDSLSTVARTALGSTYTSAPVVTVWDYSKFTEHVMRNKRFMDLLFHDESKDMAAIVLRTENFDSAYILSKRLEKDGVMLGDAQTVEQFLESV